MDAKQGLGFGDAEVDMTVKVYKMDGTVTEMKGNPVSVELPADLVQEYKALTSRLREIEKQFIDIMSGNARE